MSSVADLRLPMRARNAGEELSLWLTQPAVVRPAIAGASALVCFGAGAIAARNNTQGIMLIGGLLSLVLLLVRPLRMVDVAIFLSFASLPPALRVGTNVGPLTVYPYEAAVVLAIVFLMFSTEVRFGDLIPGWIFLVTIAIFTARGHEAGNDIERLARESQFLVEMVAGFMLAVLIVRAGAVRQALLAVGVTLWFSAIMLVISSLTGLVLSGRTESLVRETGASEAVRLLTSTQALSMAVLCVLAAAYLMGVARASNFVAFGIPSLVTTLLSFSRSTLIALALTVACVALAAMSRNTLVRVGKLIAYGAVVTLGLVPLLLYLLGGSGAGTWLSDQVSAFTIRVFGGVSTNALAVDSSTIARLHENANLERAIEQSPLLGHGLGYAYQLPFWKAGEFSATLGTTYAHNFYLWWLVKAGVFGTVMLAVFALTPIVRALTSRSVPALICAAVAVGLLFVCIVDPLPLDPPNALVLGGILGAAMGFATMARSGRQTGTPGTGRDLRV
ncbi:O-antigen ligase-like membrane protein [Rhodococcus sp. OK611]|uniref:O-antigen ligase family protein n=1 Tax=unclassified Rhodococcus (in: high G+C Gram-positive bacteria) TaxID=192944 RepID=UPI000BDC7285|nr:MULTISPECIES: O-antigen ligase family protein [unclassified Rhodococcus (in: high G+C Gram-positive bacteria)]PTR42823.1 O-antigen ligase-like membrane protein [Rhodococcus sp. OK611]SNX91820.1 O-Antigen ligase [Rhodococcus sp. OK270]